MLLKVGSKGEHVRVVQSRLNTTDDGIFGGNTEKLLNQWKSEHDLKEDGIVDDETWSFIINDKWKITGTDYSAPNLEKLKGHISNEIITALSNNIFGTEISNRLRLCHFLSQCSHESAHFKITAENLNYKPERLLAIFPRYFDETAAAHYAGKPELIAAKVYANRNGNGSEASREGFIYRGRGYIQLTGKKNYADFAKYVGDDTLNNPDLVATKYPLASAYYYFTTRNLWSLCDIQDADEAVERITRVINGGRNGLDDRKRLFHDYHDLLS